MWTDVICPFPDLCIFFSDSTMIFSDFMTFALNVIQGNIWKLELGHKIHINFKFVLAAQKIIIKKQQNDKNKSEKIDVVRSCCLIFLFFSDFFVCVANIYFLSIMHLARRSRL